jgi:Putative zinc-finger
MIDHAEDEKLERYSLGALDDTDSARVEEHLLICETCRERLEEADVYTAAMRGAAQFLRVEMHSRARQPARSWWPLWSDALAVGLALLVFALAWGPWRIRKPATMPPVAVLLETTRDSRTQTAPSSRPLLLTADLTQLARYPAYRLEVVDATGRRLIGSSLTPGGGTLSLPIPGGLARGAYYVRLYAASGEFLREFGLRVT